MKKRYYFIIIPIILIFIFGCYILSLYAFFPKPAEMEEITAQTLSQEFIFSEENKPTPSCHASTLCKFKGKIYTAWFGGTGESKPAVTIWLSSHDGTSWSTPIDMSEIKNIAHWNPVLFVYQNEIYLYYKIGLKPSNWTTYFRKSSDGVNWSNEATFDNNGSGRGPSKNKPILLSNGEVLAPVSIEYYKIRHAQCFVDISTDMTNWKKMKDVQGNIVTEMIQPTLVEIENGKVLMFLRTNRGRIFVSKSKDFGHS